MALGLGGRVVPATGGVLLHLPENPGVGGGSAANHHGVAAGFANHPLGVFGSIDVTITNDGNSHRLLHGGDDAPVGSARIALQARARVHGDAFDADVFRHFCDFDRHDRIFVPAGSQLDGQGNFDGGANHFENFSQEREIAQQARAAALDDFFGGAAQ